jgi:hypothetical protein
MRLADIKVYTRGQMEWALWRQLNHVGHDPIRPAPRVFGNRIKKLLDLDKASGGKVFSSGPAGWSPGSGVAVEYHRFGVFLMWLGLTLLDAGFKQSDVLFLLSHIKAPLRDEPYEYILKNPPSPGQMMFHSDRPNCPPHPVRQNHADCSVFLMIRKIELRECWNWAKDDPFIFGPRFCYGLTDLQKQMDRLNSEYPSTMVIELAEAITTLNGILENSPRIMRGRKRQASANEIRTKPEQPIVVRKIPRLISHKRKPAAS